MTLRGTLLALIAVPGLCLLLLSGWLLTATALTLHRLQTASATVSDRDALLALATALTVENLGTVERLTARRGSTESAIAPSSAQNRTDAALGAVQAVLARRDDTPATQRTRALGEILTRHRTQMALPDALAHWQSGLAAQDRALAALSLQLAAPADLPDPHLHGLVTLRDLALRALHDLMRNRAKIELALDHTRTGPRTGPTPDAATGASGLLADPLSVLHANTDAAIGAASMARDHARLMPVPATTDAVQALDFLADAYRPVEDRLLDLLAAATLPEPGSVNDWRAASRSAMAHLVHADAALAAATTTEFAGRIRAGQLRLTAWVALAVAASGATLFGIRFVLRHVSAPLASMQAALQSLSRDDFSNPQQARTPLPELAMLQSLLRHMAESGQRRQHMQAELARLGDRVVTANRQMVGELEAAARVQRAQLPATPFSLPGGSFHALFRPSRVVAGDTYDCITLPDGRSIVFQIDVAGHGAPAALVSIASHIALKQALLTAPAGEPVAAAIARVNRTWADHLPYFTLLVVEIDPATATARIVQCGHPALLRLPATGGIHAIGEGGLPIGVLPHAAFTTLVCPFLPGDRLVLATDGVTEAADPGDRMFGDARFRDLLCSAPHTSNAPPVQAMFDRIERALWDWRGSEIHDDDITILVLEAS